MKTYAFVFDFEGLVSSAISPYILSIPSYLVNTLFTAGRSECEPDVKRAAGICDGGGYPRLPEGK
jgi:hypothetical protein